MTAREKLQRDHSDWAKMVKISCPCDHGILDPLPGCTVWKNVGKCTPMPADICEACWDRVIPEEKEKEKEMTAVKETQCTRCIHREVCSFKKDFLDAQETVDKAIYKLDVHSNGVRICDIPFIYPVELKCKYYYSPTESARRYDYDQCRTSSNSESNIALY